MSALSWAIVTATIVFIITRPWRLNSVWWALLGAGGLVAAGAIGPWNALGAVRHGFDVYLFLIGMVALSEFARRDGLFDWVAAQAARIAGTSRLRLFIIVYGVGAVTTTFFSNDATIVVLTPAVIATLRRFDTSPVPYVVACALIANAASFVLPISNPSNLLVYASGMPRIGPWLSMFALPSLVAIVVTFASAAWWFRRDLRGDATQSTPASIAHPSTFGIVILLLSAATIISMSAHAGPLGATTFGCAALAWIFVIASGRKTAFRSIWNVSWPIVALTAALFVVVGAIGNSGLYAATQSLIEWCARLGWPLAPVAVGLATGLASNVVTNLPVALNLGETLPAMHAASPVTSAALVGVNLGPNLSINGSLATILWLAILQREQIPMRASTFFKLGVAITVPALILTGLTIR